MLLRRYLIVSRCLLRDRRIAVAALHLFAQGERFFLRVNVLRLYPFQQFRHLLLRRHNFGGGQVDLDRAQRPNDGLKLRIVDARMWLDHSQLLV